MYSDTITSFGGLLVKDRTFTIHYQNIQLLAIEIYKSMNNLPEENLIKFPVRNSHNYNLRSRWELTVPSINTWKSIKKVPVSKKVKIQSVILDQ